MLWSVKMGGALTILSVWLVGVLFLTGNSRGMEMDIAFTAGAPRSAGPMPVTVDLQGEEAIEKGILDIQLFEESARLLHYRTDPMVVTKDPRTLRLLLPPIVPPEGDQVEFRLRFEGETRHYERRDIYVSVPAKYQRYAVRAFVMDAAEDPPPAVVDVLTQGRLEVLMDLDRFRPRRVFTWQARLDPDNLPATPLRLCGYDMVVIAGAGLARVTESQWQALETWVRAGGSLLVFANPNIPLPASGPFPDFLDRIAERSKAAPEGVFQPVSPDLTVRGWIADLGRVARVDGVGPATDVESPGWRRLFCFLWKVRDLETVDRAVIAQSQREPSADDPMVTRVVQLGSHNSLRSALLHDLMPKEIRLLSVKQLAYLMAGFLLVIGPLEFWWWRRSRYRWLTWVSFPLIVLATAAVSFGAGSKLMGDDVINTLTLIDMGHDGTPVRSVALRLQFGRGDEARQLDYDNALVSGVPSHLSQPWMALEQIRENSPTYRGRYPEQFSVTRALTQWKPVVDHQLTLAPQIALPENIASFDWAHYHRLMVAGVRSRKEILQQVLAETGADGVHCHWGADAHDHSTAGAMGGFLKHSFSWYQSHPSRAIESLSVGFAIGHHTQTWLPFPQPVSPLGDWSLTDWPLVDHQQWLLIWKEGSERRIARFSLPIFN